MGSRANPRSQKRDLHPTDEDLSVGTLVLGHPAGAFSGAGLLRGEASTWGHPSVRAALIRRDYVRAGWSQSAGSLVRAEPYQSMDDREKDSPPLRGSFRRESRSRLPR